MTTPKPPRAPENLGPAGRKFWRQANRERIFREAHDLARLEIAARTLDEIESDEATLRIEGRYQTDEAGRIVAHPALKSLKENRAIFLRVIRELALDIVQAGPSSPPALY